MAAIEVYSFNVFISIYNTQSKAQVFDDDSNCDDRSFSIDASKRQRDERLNKVMSQFNSKDSYSVAKNSKTNSRYKNDDDDDEDDIVAMMDKMNR